VTLAKVSCAGEMVASGVYFYSLEIPRLNESRKMVIIR
jgi:hypothetical protein